MGTYLKSSVGARSDADALITILEGEIATDFAVVRHDAVAAAEARRVTAGFVIQTSLRAALDGTHCRNKRQHLATELVSLAAS